MMENKERFLSHRLHHANILLGAGKVHQVNWNWNSSILYIYIYISRTKLAFSGPHVCTGRVRPTREFFFFNSWKKEDLKHKWIS